jgi:glutamine synthetase
MSTELQDFLRAHPTLRFIDLLLHDMNGVDRGKRIDVASAAGTWREGLLLPASMFAIDVQGHTLQQTGLGFDDGDADRLCLPLPGTLLSVPWLDHGVAQAQLTMHEGDGRPFFGDPRQQLLRLLGHFEAAGLTPVVAVELEFYLIDRERTPEGLPQPPRGLLTGRREHRTQINSMTDLDEFSAVLADIDAVCHAQQVPATTALAEYGPGQYEVNLAHQADALAACDQAVRFRRIVKAVARRHGLDATFIPKPYRDMAGSGLHLHVSVLDRSGLNIFAAGRPGADSALRQGVAGMLKTMPDGMALFGPHANSWRRFQPASYVPLQANWSTNNRGTALRIPVSDAANRRIEHRVAGADANVYLVTAWALAGLWLGLTRELQPPPALEGNAYGNAAAGPAGGEPLPRHWALAIERFAASEFAAEVFGQPFRDLYATLKRGEMTDFDSHVTPLECQLYLGPL